MPTRGQCLHSFFAVVKHFGWKAVSELVWMQTPIVLLYLVSAVVSRCAGSSTAHAFDLPCALSFLLCRHSALSVFAITLPLPPPPTFSSRGQSWSTDHLWHVYYGSYGSAEAAGLSMRFYATGAQVTESSQWYQYARAGFGCHWCPALAWVACSSKQWLESHQLIHPSKTAHRQTPRGKWLK